MNKIDGRFLVVTGITTLAVMVFRVPVRTNLLLIVAGVALGVTLTVIGWHKMENRS